MGVEMWRSQLRKGSLDLAVLASPRFAAGMNRMVGALALADP